MLAVQQVSQEQLVQLTPLAVHQQAMVRHQTPKVQHQALEANQE
jgi:hypothetical protein